MRHLKLYEDYSTPETFDPSKEFISISDEKLFKQVVNLLKDRKLEITTDATDKSGLIHLKNKSDYMKAYDIISRQYRGQFHILGDIEYSYEE